MYNYTVIIPYRDKYDMLVKAVGSIPDRDDIQIIIVDNSTICLPNDEVPQKREASVVFTTSSPTKGAGAARNIGLKYVEGKYILFLDADDYFTPEAFLAFDKYLEQENDIVFFKPTSIKLSDGSVSSRHLGSCSSIDTFFQTGNDEFLRYRWHGPVCKMFLSSFVLQGEFQFEEIKVNNDAWFSMMTGHYATKIDADKSIVYVITEGENGSTLTQQKTRENLFLRYDCDIRMNKFLKSVGHYKMRNRLLGAMNIAFKQFGLKELLRYMAYAIKHKAGIF